MIMFLAHSVILMTIRSFLDDIFIARYGIRVLFVNLMTDDLLYLNCVRVAHLQVQEVS